MPNKAIKGNKKGWLYFVQLIYLPLSQVLGNLIQGYWDLMNVDR
jgi:hypothetical protein